MAIILQLPTFPVPRADEKAARAAAHADEDVPALDLFDVLFGRDEEASSDDDDDEHRARRSTNLGPGEAGCSNTDSSSSSDEDCESSDEDVDCRDDDANAGQRVRESDAVDEKVPDENKKEEDAKQTSEPLAERPPFVVPPDCPDWIPLLIKAKMCELFAKEMLVEGAELARIANHLIWPMCAALRATFGNCKRPSASELLSILWSEPSGLLEKAHMLCALDLMQIAVDTSMRMAVAMQQAQMQQEQLIALFRAQQMHTNQSIATAMSDSSASAIACPSSNSRTDMELSQNPANRDTARSISNGCERESQGRGDRGSDVVLVSQSPGRKRHRNAEERAVKHVKEEPAEPGMTDPVTACESSPGNLFVALGGWMPVLNGEHRHNVQLPELALPETTRATQATIKSILKKPDCATKKKGNVTFGINTVRILKRGADEWRGIREWRAEFVLQQQRQQGQGRALATTREIASSSAGSLPAID